MSSSGTRRKLGNSIFCFQLLKICGLYYPKLYFLNPFAKSLEFSISLVLSFFSLHSLSAFHYRQHRHIGWLVVFLLLKYLSANDLRILMPDCESFRSVHTSGQLPIEAQYVSPPVSSTYYRDNSRYLL